VYARNPAYAPRPEPASGAAGGKIVNFDRFEWHYIPDHQSAMNALINGEVDYWEQPPADPVSYPKQRSRRAALPRSRSGQEDAIKCMCLCRS